MAKRDWMLWPLLLAALAVFSLCTPAVKAQEQEKWTKVDCAGADAHLTPPPGVPAECFVGPMVQPRGQTYACRLSNYSFGVPLDATAPRSWARMWYPRKQGKFCSTTAFADPVDKMQHANKFVEAEAIKWSGIQDVGNDVTIMFFDAKNQKREGKCFTFIKQGPMAGEAGGGHQFTIIGFLCKPPGQPLDVAAAAAMVNGIHVNIVD